MSKINDGGPAYPMHPNSWEYGMTLRDWFAGQALAGMGLEYTSDKFCHASVAECAYRYADAMLKAREVKP
jgi:hypothetical protein